MTPEIIPSEAFHLLAPPPKDFLEQFDAANGSPFLQMMREHGERLPDGSLEFAGVKLLAAKNAKPIPQAGPSAQQQLADRRFAAIQEQREIEQRKASRAPLVAELDKLESKKGLVGRIRFAKPAANSRKKKVPEVVGSKSSVPVNGSGIK